MPDPVEAKLTSFYEQLHDSIVYSFLSTPAGRLLFNYFERRRQPTAERGDDVHGSGMHEMEICSAFFFLSLILAALRLSTFM
jgi:hypothetical protein